jgi:hypothetical protein
VLAGAQVRRYETLQIERWLMLRTGGEANIGFARRRISTSPTADIERFSLPSTAARKEQLGALLFRFGHTFGW